MLFNTYSVIAVENTSAIKNIYNKKVVYVYILKIEYSLYQTYLHFRVLLDNFHLICKNQLESNLVFEVLAFPQRTFLLVRQYQQLIVAPNRKESVKL